MKYFIKTFGCQMNEADSERIITALEKKKYKKAKSIKEAGLVIINSCIVRQSAENRVYGLIRNLKKRKTLPKIILTGCLAGWALNDKSGKNKRVLRRKTGSEVKIVLLDKLTEIETKPKREKIKLAFVPISNGCNHLCSYCIVPYARGREVYRSKEKIVSEVDCALKQGFDRIMLLGQSVNSWQGKGKVKTFPQLLEKVAQVPGINKFVSGEIDHISFLSANPWDFSDELIEVIAKYGNISREIHLPVQSGNSQILKKMNRNYTANQYLTLIRKIRKRIKGVEITTDIIVGFPGETKKAFQETVDLCKEVGFKRAFVAKYSPRPGTVAAKLYQDNVSPQEKKRRWQIIDKLINR